MFTTVCGVFLLFSASLAASDGPIVKTPLGAIQGYLGKSYSNRPFTNFMSVPYAQPPVGPLRFKDAVPVLPWPGVWVANFTSRCAQNGPEEVLGEENCLFMNIFVPSADPARIRKKLPVLFDIHGGAYMFGYGYDYAGPIYMMDRDVILITINYRVGAFGFLSTEDDVVPGNIGLKDQVAALRWVNRYISYFGGDPSQITLTGMSAGGASVNYHYMSPMSKGLYKNGISFSGVSLNPWAFQDAPLQKAKRLGSACGCNQASVREMINCLRTRSARQIVTASIAELEVWLGNPFSPFGPVVEKTSHKRDAFLSEHPYKLMATGRVNDVPWIVTHTTDEGLYPSASFLNNADYLPYIDEHWLELCPSLYDFNYTIPLSQHAEVCSKIKQFYWDDQPVSNETFLKLTKSLTDRHFVLGLEQGAQIQARVNKAPVYMYSYNYTAEKQPSLTVLFSTAPKQGVSHGDDMMMIFSLFQHGIPFFNMTEDDKKIQDVLLDFILSFAKNGVPTSGDIRWDPVQKTGDLNYLQINSPSSIEMREAVSTANKDFWDQFPFNENENFSEDCDE